MDNVIKRKCLDIWSRAKMRKELQGYSSYKPSEKADSINKEFLIYRNKRWVYCKDLDRDHLKVLL